MCYVRTLSNMADKRNWRLFIRYGGYVIDVSKTHDLCDSLRLSTKANQTSVHLKKGMSLSSSLRLIL